MNTIQVTDAQLRLVQLLDQAYEVDIPVHFGTKTEMGDDVATAKAIVAERIIRLGLARRSKPYGRCLLITEAGREIARHKAA